MTLRSLFVFIHVVSAMGVFGTLAIEGALLLRLRRAADTADRLDALSGFRLLRVLAPLSLGPTVMSGMYLVRTAWGWHALDQRRVCQSRSCGRCPRHNNRPESRPPTERRGRRPRSVNRPSRLRTRFDLIGVTRDEDGHYCGHRLPHDGEAGIGRIARWSRRGDRSRGPCESDDLVPRCRSWRDRPILEITNGRMTRIWRQP